MKTLTHVMEGILSNDFDIHDGDVLNFTDRGVKMLDFRYSITIPKILLTDSLDRYCMDHLNTSCMKIKKDPSVNTTKEGWLVNSLIRCIMDTCGDEQSVKSFLSGIFRKDIKTWDWRETNQDIMVFVRFNLPPRLVSAYIRFSMKK